MSLRSSILKWLTADESPKVTKNPLRAIDTVSADYDDLGTKDQSVAFRVLKAMNGRVIEISTFAASPHGGRDRKVELYLVPEDKKLTEAIVHVLAIQALER